MNLINKSDDRFIPGMPQGGQYCLNTTSNTMKLLKLRTEKSKFSSICDYYHTYYLVRHITYKVLAIKLYHHNMYAQTKTSPHGGCSYNCMYLIFYSSFPECNIY